jgi:DnaJ-class molecular chaperone
MIENCDDCVGMGKVREEGETPRQDRWHLCGTCNGSGEVDSNKPRRQRRKKAGRKA